MLVKDLIVAGIGPRPEAISFQEFVKLVLPTGKVHKILIENRSVAHVFMDDKINLQQLKDYQPMNGGMQHNTDSEDWQEVEVTTPASSTRTTTAVDLYAASTDDPYDSHGKEGAMRSDKQEQLEQLLKQYPQFSFSIGSVDSFERQLEKAQATYQLDPISVEYSHGNDWLLESFRMLPNLIYLGLGLAFIMRFKKSMSKSGGMGGMFKVGKSTATKVKKEDIHITFKDVAGVDEPKKEIMEFVEFLKNQKKFTDLGAKIPKGALLVGPPGTGKTMLAKATAGEADVPFYSLSGSDFLEMFVGVGPARVRDLFKEARANAPCIIFIDEIDAVARARSSQKIGGNDERENTLNALLVEMDGFASQEGVVVLAGTNRVDILDKAILRPGRFDRQIQVDLPDIKGRHAIFLVHTKKLKIDVSRDELAGRMAALTPGFSGADIANICNEAAIVAARRSATGIVFKDFEEAVDRIIGGMETNRIMTPEEKKTVAYHEAGHAVAGWFLEHADPLLKVTIVPRGKGSLGYAQYLPKEVSLHSTQALCDTMCMALGGRAAEALTFNGTVTTGAQSDLQRVTGLAYAMVREYGMNEKIGQVSFPKNSNDYGGGDRDYSDATAQTIDEEVRKLVDESYRRTKALLHDKQAEMTALAEDLILNETINHDDIVRVLGPRPFVGHKSYNEYVEQASLDKLKVKDDEKVETEVEENSDDTDQRDEEEVDLAQVQFSKELNSLMEEKTIKAESQTMDEKKPPSS